MTKATFADWDTTADNNTDINDVPLGEGATYPRHANNAMREIMAQTKVALYPAANIGTQEVKVAGYTALAADSGKTLVADSGSAIEFALTAAATLGDGWYFIAKNEGAGTLTLNPNGAETIDGAATLDLATGESRMVFCDGTNFRTVFAGGSASGTIGGSTGATDNRLLRADGTGGATLQASAITVDDSGNMSGVGTINGAPIRERLTAARSYYVRTDGNDSNNGLANTSGGAFATLQKAHDVIFGQLDLGGYNVTVHVGTGTYTAGVSATSAQVGAGNVTFTGDTTTPSNVTISATGTYCFYIAGGARLFIEGFKLTSTANLMLVESGGYAKFTNKNEFGSATGHQIMVAGGGRVDATAPEIISGTSAGGHYNVSSQGYLYCQTATWTASGTATIGIFAWCENLGHIYAYANTSSGTFSGIRYRSYTNSVIQTVGGGASYFPGSSAGSTATGGQYA